METQAMVIGGVEYRVCLDEAIPENFVVFLPDEKLKELIRDMDTMRQLICWSGKYYSPCAVGHPKKKVSFLKHYGDGYSLNLCNECGHSFVMKERVILNKFVFGKQK